MNLRLQLLITVVGLNYDMAPLSQALGTHTLLMFYVKELVLFIVACTMQSDCMAISDLCLTSKNK